MTDWTRDEHGCWRLAELAGTRIEERSSGEAVALYWKEPDGLTYFSACRTLGQAQMRVEARLPELTRLALELSRAMKEESHG